MATSQIDRVIGFVKSATLGRDPTHGLEHAEKVASNAKQILHLKGESEETNFDCVVVALIHDVSDHKYDRNGKLALLLMMFLIETFGERQGMLYYNIAERVSYSKEVKAKGNLDWNDILGEYGCYIRDIVSDADKMEAIGKTGIQRCIEYTRHSNEGISHFELVLKVMKHSEEKLLRLHKEYIRTPEGKKLAKPLHDEMVISLSELIKTIDDDGWTIE